MSKRFLICGALALGVAGLLPGRIMAQAHKPGDVPGPIDSLADVQDTAKMLFKLADTNNDGQISQKEAVDAGNLLVGGFFFRADANGDGTLTPEEARAEGVVAEPAALATVRPAEEQADQWQWRSDWDDRPAELGNSEPDPGDHQPA